MSSKCFILSSLFLFTVLQKGDAIMSTDVRSRLEDFNYCMRSEVKEPNFRNCISYGALRFLQNIEENHSFLLTPGLVTVKDETVSGRSFLNLLDADPVDYRGILEQAGVVFSQRSLEFHMDSLYPGLLFKIGPSADANSVAEFVLDPAVNERNYIYGEPTTARILTKQYLLPVLLGLKFKLVALVPLLFAGICLLLKKSLFLTKFALYVSSALGFGGAFGTLGGLFGSYNGFSGNYGGLQHSFGPTTFEGDYFSENVKHSIRDSHNNANQFNENFHYKRFTDSLQDAALTPDFDQEDNFYKFNNEERSASPVEFVRSDSKWKAITM